MGFFGWVEKGPPTARGLKNLSVSLLHKHECNVCPLNNEKGLRHPHMAPTGDDKPVVYILGEAPGETEDRRGEQFVGDAGSLLRPRIPKDWEEHIRWNNVVRTRPPKNRTPTDVEIECCRPSIVRDIEKAQPTAIFGFGNVPLHWVLKQTGITKWRGRYIPVKIGTHTCWFFPMLHPSGILRQRRYTPHRLPKVGDDRWPAEEEFVFAMELERAFATVEKLPLPVVHTPDFAWENIETIDGGGGDRDVAGIESFLESVYDDEFIGLDLETNTTRPMYDGAKILTCAVATAKRSVAFTIDHSQSPWTPSQRGRVWEALRRFVRKSRGVKCVHSLAFEMEWFAVLIGHEYIRGAKGWGDSLSQCFILDERMKMGKPDANSLEFLCIQYFGINVKELSKGLNRKQLDVEPLDKVLRYNALDAKYHRLLFRVQRRRVIEEGLEDVYKAHLRRIPAAVLTQIKGVPIDQERVRTLRKKYRTKQANALNELDALPVIQKFRLKHGRDFEPASNRDVLLLVQKMLGKPIESADEKALATINHPFAAAEVKWRKAHKILSTYVDPVREGSDSSHLFPDGNIHPITNTTSTRTWRTSSEDPNYQNWPKRDKESKEIRGLVHPGPGFKIVSFDYGQIQARNVAQESQDPALVKYMWDRHDIHEDWTEWIAKHYPRWFAEGHKTAKADAKLWSSYRHKSKNQFVFPSFFGAQPKSISKNIGLPLEITEAMQAEFYDKFQGVRRWQERLRKLYFSKGFVQALCGFRRRAPISPNEIINTPIQADESAIVLDAMIRLSEMEEFDRYQPNMEIHDDLTFVWPTKEVDRNAERVIDAMLDCSYEWAHRVPIVVEMSIGNDWANTEKVGDFWSDRWTKTFEKAERVKLDGLLRAAT